MPDPIHGLSEIAEAEWSRYLRDLAIHNTFFGRPVLTGVDWSRKPKHLKAAA